ncbi:MAG: thioesterase family protein [Acidimicrobiia bacterium]|nr:thioesterase family protein [Acidimicrobiia bacterium]
MPTDADFLELRTDETTDRSGRFRFTVLPRLSRLDGRLYGGTAISVAITTAELVTGRPALWATTQFVSTVEQGAVVEVAVDVLAGGSRTSQVRVTGTGPDGSVVFAALGATGHHRPDGLNGQFERFPTVTAPEASRPWSSPFTGLAEAAGLEDPSPPGGTGFGAAVEITRRRGDGASRPRARTGVRVGASVGTGWWSRRPSPPSSPTWSRCRSRTPCR